MPVSAPSSHDRMSMHNANRLKIGLFGANCSSGRAVTLVPERWSGTWPDNLRLARMADEAGIGEISGRRGECHHGEQHAELLRPHAMRSHEEGGGVGQIDGERAEAEDDHEGRHERATVAEDAGVAADEAVKAKRPRAPLFQGLAQEKPSDGKKDGGGTTAGPRSRAGRAAACSSRQGP